MRGRATGLMIDGAFGTGYPLIPTFSPKGEKESDAHIAHERAERSGSTAPLSLERRRETPPAADGGSVRMHPLVTVWQFPDCQPWTAAYIRRS